MLKWIRYDSDSGDYEFEYEFVHDCMFIRILANVCDLARVLAISHRWDWGTYHADTFTWTESVIERHKGVKLDLSDTNYREEIQTFKDAFGIKHDVYEETIMLVIKELYWSAPRDKLMPSEEFENDFKYHITDDFPFGFVEFDGRIQTRNNLTIDKLCDAVKNENLHSLMSELKWFDELEAQEWYRKITPWIPRKKK